LGVRDSGVRFREARRARTRENDGVERLDGRDKRERVSDHAAGEIRSTGRIRGNPMHDTRTRDQKQSRAAQDCRAASARRVLESAAPRHAGPTSGIDCTGTPRVLPAPGRQTLSWLQPAREDYTERAKRPPSRGSACSGFPKATACVRIYTRMPTRTRACSPSHAHTYTHTHTRYPVHVVTRRRQYVPGGSV